MQISHDLAIGGLQQVVVNICKSIDRDRFDVTVLCLRALGEFAPEITRLGIKVFLLPQKKNGTDYFTFWKLSKMLRQERTNVIHTHNTQPFIDGTIAALLSNVKTVVHTDHARDFPDKRRYMLAEWIVSKYAYRVVGVSAHTAENLSRYERISKKKIRIIPNGIDLLKYEISVDQVSKRRNLGIREKGPVIGLGVRLTEQKGIPYLIRAMPEVLQKFPDATLVIAGDGPMAPELKKETTKLGLENHVLFIGPRLDIPEILKLFDIYVLPSVWEGLPMVILEAMAARCPIIATDVGGVRNVIANGLNGSIVEPRNSSVLSAEIIKLLSNKALRASYTRAAHDTVSTKFSAETMTRKYEKLYLRED